MLYLHVAGPSGGRDALACQAPTPHTPGARTPRNQPTTNTILAITSTSQARFSCSLARLEALDIPHPLIPLPPPLAPIQKNITKTPTFRICPILCCHLRFLRCFGYLGACDIVITIIISELSSPLTVRKDGNLDDTYSLPCFCIDSPSQFALLTHRD